MRFWFEENMYGTFREIRPQGSTGRFDFWCHAEASMGGFMRDKTMRIHGTVTMEGVVEGASMEGTLKIDLLGEKELVYDFTFLKDGSRYRFLGRKNVRYLSPLSSMTTLIGKVEKDGVTYADVESHFHLLDLPSFLASWRLGL